MRYGGPLTTHLREFLMPVTRVAVPLLDLHAQYGPLREEISQLQLIAVEGA